MSVSIVNGYVCYSGCDEAKARSGKDPQAKPGEVEDDKTKTGSLDAPATLYGGALAELDAPGAVTPVGATADTATAGNGRRPLLDILV